MGREAIHIVIWREANSTFDKFIKKLIEDEPFERGRCYNIRKSLDGRTMNQGFSIVS